MSFHVMEERVANVAEAEHVLCRVLRDLGYLSGTDGCDAEE